MTSSQKLHGVNLGGWLVLEKWMTPTMFDGNDAIDEYTFMQLADGADRIEHHRKTFITEEDFEWLEKNGINAVRIPVGYWLFDGDTPYTPAIEYLDWAVEMAKKYHLKVLISLHGAPGSQNGSDHSGRVGEALWYSDAKYQQQTIEVLEKIAIRYIVEPTVWGIELLNEPKFDLIQWKLRKFYRQAYKRLTAVSRPGMYIVFHDAFTPRLLSGAIKATKSNPVMMDIHWYHFADWFKQRPIGWYFYKLAHRTRLLGWLQRMQPVIIGEWNLVIADQVMRKYTKEQDDKLIRHHAQLQLDTYTHAAGWFYWTYKTEKRGIWHFRSQVEDGVIKLG